MIFPVRPVRALIYLTLIVGWFWKVMPVLGQPRPVVAGAITLVLFAAGITAAVAVMLYRTWSEQGGEAPA